MLLTFAAPSWLNCEASRAEALCLMVDDLARCQRWADSTCSTRINAELIFASRVLRTFTIVRASNYNILRWWIV